MSSNQVPGANPSEPCTNATLADAYVIHVDKRPSDGETVPAEKVVALLRLSADGSNLGSVEVRAF